MERHFNMLKNRYISLHEYQTDEQFHKAVEKFVYVHYNYMRPHSYFHLLGVTVRRIRTRLLQKVPFIRVRIKHNKKPGKPIC